MRGDFCPWGAALAPAKDIVRSEWSHVMYVREVLKVVSKVPNGHAAQLYA